MVEFTKTIKDPLGLHARPVALLYDIIAKHRSNVSVSIGDRHTDGRDVMGLMALYGECGEDIIFRISGVDDQKPLALNATRDCGQSLCHISGRRSLRCLFCFV